MHLLRQESLVCIFESPRLVALFDSTHTDETALYNLNNVVHAFVMHIRYCSIITSLLHASPCVSPCVVRVESAKSYRGKLRFHVTGRGFSTRRLVAFPRDDTWHFHETSRGISTIPVTVEFSRDQ